MNVMNEKKVSSTNFIYDIILLCNLIIAEEFPKRSTWHAGLRLHSELIELQWRYNIPFRTKTLDVTTNS